MVGKLCFLALFLGFARGQSQAERALPGGSPSLEPRPVIAPGIPASPLPKEPRISMDVQEADIHSVLRFLSTTARLNIVADERVTGTVTLRLEEVPFDDAFRALLLTQGLVYGDLGGVIWVAPR
jgi:type II secretory pathway component HofQ